MSIIDKKQALGQGKPLGSSSKLPPPKKEKDTTAYYGDSISTPAEIDSWVIHNKNYIFRTTLGRVTESKLHEYGKTLANPSKFGSLIEKDEKNRMEPGRMQTAMKKGIGKPQSDAARIDKKEDMEIAKKMWGWGKK